MPAVAQSQIWLSSIVFCNWAVVGHAQTPQGSQNLATLDLEMADFGHPKTSPHGLPKRAIGYPFEFLYNLIRMILF